MKILVGFCFVCMLTACLPSAERHKTLSNTSPNFELVFKLVYGDQPVLCESGQLSFVHNNQKQNIQAFAFYVHALELVDNTFSNRTVESDANTNTPPQFNQYPIGLVSNEWQHNNIALILFDATCANDKAAYNTHILAQIDAIDLKHLSKDSTKLAQTKLRMKLGVPFSQNHVNPLIQPSPLNISSMFWSWRNGYKFMRLDVDNKTDSFSLHLGSAGCDSAAVVRAPSSDCQYANVVDIEIPVQISANKLIPAQHNVSKVDEDVTTVLLTVDLKALLDKTDITSGQSCMFMGIDQIDACQTILNALHGQKVLRQAP